MPKPPLLLTALSEVQRSLAQERFEIIRPALEEGVTQAHVARTHNIPASTIQLWIKRYLEKGFAGLANAGRSDKGKSRRLPTDTLGLIEGLALQTPPRSMASIHRQVVTIAKCQELSGQKVSLKEIEKARSERRKEVRAGVTTRTKVVDRYHAPSTAISSSAAAASRTTTAQKAAAARKRGGFCNWQDGSHTNLRSVLSISHEPCRSGGLAPPSPPRLPH